MKSPPHLLKSWREIERRIHRARPLFLFTDFDGTLVPIARTPEQVRLPHRVRRLLAMLRRKGAIVGVISGRSLADLRARVGLRDIWYVGSHGYSLSGPGSRTVRLLRPAQKARMVEVQRKLGEKVRGLTGVWLERKEGAIAVHYRSASRRTAAAARALIRHSLAAYPSVRLLRGKKVWELLPERRVSKWTAIRLILAQERRAGLPLLFYLGDDSTDERVFEQMEGISVAVGKRRRTAARFYLRSPGEVLLFLERLCVIVQ